MANRFWENFNQGLSTGQKIWEADSERRMRAELAAANRMAPEQQSLGVNAPAAGAVPVGYENYIQAQEGGGFAPKVDQGLSPADLEQRRVIAERFSAPGAFQGERTSYSLGGVSRPTAFTPEEVAQARMERKADIYSDYGREDVAEQMRTNALARKASALNIKKLQNEVDDAEAFRNDLRTSTDMLRSGAEVKVQAAELINKGDYKGAAQLMADWRTKNVPGGEMLRVNEQGIMEGSKDGGKTWIQASPERGNVMDPKVVNNMLGEIKNSAEEHLSRIMFKHARTPEALSSMINAAKQLSMEQEKFAENKRQFGISSDLESRKLDVTEQQFKDKLDLMKEELRLKGLTIPSEISKNYAAGQYYTRSVGLDAYKLAQLQAFDAERNDIIKQLEAGKLTKNEAQEKLNMAGLKFGGQLKETKEFTAKDAKDMEEALALRYPSFNKLPVGKQQELRDNLKVELGFASPKPTVDLVSAAAADRGEGFQSPAPAPRVITNEARRGLAPFYNY